MHMSVQYNGVDRIIKHIENIEKYIAIKNGKLVTHLKKWGNKYLESTNDYVTQYIVNM